MHIIINNTTNNNYHADNHNHNHDDTSGFPSGIIRENWNDTENISMAPAQG